MTNMTVRPVYRILVVDDDQRFYDLIARYLEGFDFPCEAHWAASLSEADGKLHDWRPHLILLDLQMPKDDWIFDTTERNKYAKGLRTLAFCETIVKEYPNTIVAIVSVGEIPQAAKECQAHRCYQKIDEFDDVALKELLDLVVV
jgi:CheY-like chemotaxis protein